MEAAGVGARKMTKVRSNVCVNVDVAAVSRRTLRAGTNAM